MTMQAYFIRYLIQNLLSHSPRVVFGTKVMLVGILCPRISLCRNMGKVLCFRWKGAIDAVDTKTFCIGAMRRKFPAQVRGIHFVTFAAAILGCRYGYHNQIKCNKAQHGKNYPCKKCQNPFFHAFKHPATEFTYSVLC